MTHYHFVGIGGTGLSAIARVLLERGEYVTGSDLVLSQNAQDLALLDVIVKLGHNKENIKGANFVIRSSAIPDDNAEITAARQSGIPVLKRSEFLGELTREKKVIAVAGTHGKTTTSGMIAYALTRLGLDPSFIIGSDIKNLKKNAHHGTGEYFVVEADEYDGMFLGLNPYILIVTNLEHDHPDNYPTFNSYMDAFNKLSRLISPDGKLIAEADNPNSRFLSQKVLKNHPVFLYGESSDSNYRIKDIRNKEDCGVSFSVQYSNNEGDSFSIPSVNLQIPGQHNAHNATAAIACAHLINVSSSDAALALEEFSGTGRRFELHGQKSGITIIDDYAHHPTEIRATLAAARCKYGKRQIWAVWQPHTYSRTQQLFTEFIQSFETCDHVLVTDVYAAREKPQDFTSKQIVQAMKHPDVRYVPGLRDCADTLLRSVQPGDIVIVMSAGDAIQISDWVLNEYKAGLNNG